MSLEESKENREYPSSQRIKMSSFDHQVGGHTRIRRIQESRNVCKPLDIREMYFYEFCPTPLRHFLPKYEGILRFRTDDSEQFREYIVLENLLRDFKAPCVIDFKMGVRMYGDFASEKKKNSQHKKSITSTSHNLGVRLCGCKWYDYRTNISHYLDKYSGRNLTEVEFRQYVLWILNSVGQTRRPHIIKVLIDKITQLRDIVSQMDSFRFYSSSLLISFEGGEKHVSNDVIVKLIDFANCTFEGFIDDKIVHSGPDTGFIKGLDTLLDILNSSQRKPSRRSSEDDDEFLHKDQQQSL